MTPPAGASASLSMGDGFSTGVYLTPSASPIVGRGEVVIMLGTLESGNQLSLTITSLEWLADLEDACRDAFASGIVQGGMKAAAT